MGMLKVDGILDGIETVIENTLGGIGVFEVQDGKLTPVFLNNGFYRMLGYTKEECAIFLKDIESNIIREDLEVFRQGITDVLKDDGWSEIEFKTVTKEGGIRWLQVRGNLLSRSAKSSLITAIILDATERKNIEIELAEQAERLHLLSEAEGEMIFDYNAKTDVLVIKPAKSIGGNDIMITDYMQKAPHENVYEEDRQMYCEMFSSILKKPQRDAVDVRASFFDRGVRWYRVNFASILGTEGYVTRAVGRIIDIHEKKLKELEIEARAERDPLTGLYNKCTTKEMIEASLQDAAGKNTINALLMLDLDNFKAINDNLGHAAGDEVLVEAAGNIRSNFKGRDIIGRIGGDEFIIFMRDVSEIRNAQMLGYKLNRLLTMSYPRDTGAITVTASMGIAFSGIHGNSFQELYENADKALYVTKKCGKNGCTTYEPGM